MPPALDVIRTPGPPGTAELQLGNSTVEGTKPGLTFHSQLPHCDAGGLTHNITFHPSPILARLQHQPPEQAGHLLEQNLVFPVEILR